MVFTNGKNSNSQDDFAKSKCSRCGQVATKLRAVGDNLERRFQRQLQFEKAPRENNRRRRLTHDIHSGIMKNLFALMFL